MDSMFHWILLGLGWFLSCPGSFLCAEMREETRLVNDLMVNYSKFSRPTDKYLEPVVVQAYLALKKIENLDEKNQILDSFGWLILAWVDNFLTWDPARYGNISHVLLPSEEVWIPELTVYNSVTRGGDIALQHQRRVQVHNNGILVFGPNLHWTTSCRMDLHYFPFDTQECNVTFASWNHLGTVLFQASELTMDLYEEHDTWAVINVTLGTDALPYERPLPGTLPLVYFTVKLQRVPMYHVVVTIMPCVLITILSGTVFFLPVESGEKISLSVTVCLSYTVLLLMLSDVTPKSGGQMPYLLLYVVYNMCQTGLSLVLTVLVLNVYHHSPSKRPPACLRMVVLKCLGTILCMCHLSKCHCCSRARKNIAKVANFESNVSGKDEDVSTKKQPEAILPEAFMNHVHYMQSRAREEEEIASNREEWQAIARVMDRLFLVVIASITLTGTISFVMFLL